ncbi:MAG: hypothetical protein PHW75_00290 [Patescibacteria group bacterium]|nr:hypothetical protein [Patescibacteria group bacterium]
MERNCANRDPDSLDKEADVLQPFLEQEDYRLAEEKAKKDSIAKAQELLAKNVKDNDLSETIESIVKDLPTYRDGSGALRDIFYFKAYLRSLADRLEIGGTDYDELIKALRQQALEEIEIEESE